MNRDPIVDEVRKNRREILEAFGGNFAAMAKDAMARQWNPAIKLSHVHRKDPRESPRRGSKRRRRAEQLV